MSDQEISPQDETESSRGSLVVTLVICALIALVAGAVAWWTFSTEPTAERSDATKKTAMLVEVAEVERGDFRPRIVATGTVEAARDVVLRPQVAGRITEIAPGFAPGGFVEAGEELLRIETADYEHLIAQRESALRQALSELALEQGRQAAAREEYAFLGEDLPPENEALVLREPQIEAAEERVEAARAALEQAELDLSRTVVEAPFDAHVLRRDVNLGSQVSPSESLGRLVGVETYWVGVELPLSKLRWVEIPEDGEQGSTVRVRNEQSWPAGTYRTGYLFRLIGALDPDTRMAQVLAAIPDPLGVAEEADEETEGQADADAGGADAGAGAAREKPPLMVGEFVEATILGEELEGVIRLDRDYVRDEDTVWVMEDGALQVKEVEVVLRDDEYAYVSSGLDDDDRVVTTNLSTVVEGSPLRLEGQADE